MQRRFFTGGFCWVILLCAAMARGENLLQVRPSVTCGVWEGWGCSLCWWANVFGTNDAVADLLFTTNETALFGRTKLPGLGFNIARYNAGGCGFKPVHGESMAVSEQIPYFKQIEGFWINPDNSDMASACWDWSVDANQRAALLKARARGANLLELFSNSPMWWMCVNHNPSGADNGSNDNLLAEYYWHHAHYLACVALFAKTNWGVEFDSVEPFNEPMSTWWKKDGTQEGCHFSIATQTNIIGCLRSELDHFGLTNMMVSASDENTYTLARKTWKGFDRATRAKVGRINVHGYEYSDGRRDRVCSAAKGKRLWNSEYGEDDASGMRMAVNLSMDFAQLHPTAWCYWQPFDGGGWGLIRSRLEREWIGWLNPKYYVLAQYTRHIRPGMTIIDSGHSNTVAAYSALDRKLVLVSVNNAKAQTFSFSLSKFSTATGPVSRWLTASNGSTYERSTVGISNRVITCQMPANSVQTLEIENVDWKTPR